MVKVGFHLIHSVVKSDDFVFGFHVLGFDVVFDGDDEAVPLVNFVVTGFGVGSENEEILWMAWASKCFHHEAALSVELGLL